MKIKAYIFNYEIAGKNLRILLDIKKEFFLFFLLNFLNVS